MTAFLWSLVPIFVKQILPFFDPYVIAFARYFFATLFLAFIHYFSGGRFWLGKPHQKPLIYAALAGTGNYIFYNVGIKLTTANAASLIVKFESVILIILATWFLKEPWTIHKRWGTGLCTFGLVLVGWNGQPLRYLFGSEYLLGNFLVFIAGACWAVYAVFQKILSRDLSILEILVPTFSLSSLFTGLVALLVGEPPRPPTPYALLALILLGVACTGLSYFSLGFALNRADAGVVGMVTMTLPLFTIIEAYFILGEVPTLWQIIGGAFLILGVAIISKSEQEVVVET